MSKDLLKKAAGDKAAEYVRDGMVVGLGTGSTAYHVVNAIGRRVKEEGLKISAIATSNATHEQALSLGIPMLGIDEITHVDLAIDGVDEISPDFLAIKGGGGALYREKVIASMADEVIWIMDDSKLVKEIGAFPLAVEAAPYGHVQLLRKLEAAGLAPVLRKGGDSSTFVTDNGNYILDLHLGAGFDAWGLQDKLAGMVGVLEHGLFLNMCDRIIVGRDADKAEVIENTTKGAKK